MTIEILNMRANRDGSPTFQYDFRIDRKSVLGNPKYMSKESERTSACEYYENYFAKEMQNPDSNIYKKMQELLSTYKDKGHIRLFCWCSPRRCHGETIKRWLLANA